MGGMCDGCLAGPESPVHSHYFPFTRRMRRENTTVYWFSERRVTRGQGHEADPGGSLINSTRYISKGEYVSLTMELAGKTPFLTGLKVAQYPANEL